MIWGLTPEQLVAKREEQREKHVRQNKAREAEWLNPRPWFAWHPITLDDGRRAWLETVMVRGWSNWRGDWHWGYSLRSADEGKIHT